MDPIRFNPMAPTGVPTPAVPAARAAAPAAPQAPTDQVQIEGHHKSCLLDKAKNVALAGSAGITAAGLLEAAGVVGAAGALGACAGIACLVATGMAAVHFGKKMWAKHHGGGQPQQPQQPPQPPAPPANGPPQPQQLNIVPGPGVQQGLRVAPGVPTPPGFPR